MFNDTFGTAFITLAVAHFVALVSPGADFFLIMGHAIRHGLKGSRLICLGLTIGHAFYITLAIMGLALLRDYPKLFLSIECLGALYLLWLGLILIKTPAPRQQYVNGKEPIPVLSRCHQLSMGFFTATLNPKNLIFYMSLMTAILGSHTPLKLQITAGIWMVAMVFSWDFFMAYMISRFRSATFLQAKIYLVERSAGCILILIAAGILFHMGLAIKAIL